MSTIPSEIINWTILNEIISMDDDDSDFSKGLIIQFIDQAQTTFAQMQRQLDGEKNLTELDNLGHFLKGSSAALGLQRIAWVCERIQNLGRKMEHFFPNKTELVNTLSDKSIINGINIDEDDEEIKIQVDDKDENSIYLILIAKALNQSRFEFKLARIELSKYYNTNL
ncbi:AEL_collapsed_G0006550.mRNA.1.CDS.1 [Saccharomyces cerevisiae]|uniref:Phosphorelay intermediate protein YPD1 n=1 Tax=Saccharomyces pastorianus TaxID=27292 RepID=A0A6C1DMM2_SACPS|nr:Phosphorelay intermediate protein [Saccharomyces pastorianus]CAI5239168.1 AEL_HP2_G0005390.mRNA.1.CDS.1 [Saccharomyces cerevisiae]CAI6410415.1 AEL_HP2_G0005390.mRNA.1.CDS.1 [Saccharomyces cerevisiae]CAI6416986.1 AEL_HP1_G0006640.mRNA.1.CDS.1 [Saccharomyces cerevisiae]CAI6527117.1 AEL_collapsed_G0006550.mRNA.1.CDS.1 [Saccharomyces cerevisiae]